MNHSTLPGNAQRLHERLKASSADSSRKRRIKGTCFTLVQIERFAKNAVSLKAAIIILIMCGLSKAEAKEIARYVRR